MFDGDAELESRPRLDPDHSRAEAVVTSSKAGVYHCGRLGRPVDDAPQLDLEALWGAVSESAAPVVTHHRRRVA